MAQQEPVYERSGRGGAGNFRRPSNDPDNASTAKNIIKEIKDSASAIFSSKDQPRGNKVEYVHHGRGGAGNLSTTKDQVKPVQSIIDDKATKEAKPVSGRGGAGNIRSASKERASLDEKPGNVVAVPSAEATQAGNAVLEPVPAHLGEGREVVHDGTSA